MIKKSFTIFILILCSGLFLAGCPKKQVVINREQPSVQRSEEAARLESERAAREAKERELARLREEEAKHTDGGRVGKELSRQERARDRRRGL